MEYLLGGIVVLAALAFVALPLLRSQRSVEVTDAVPTLAEQRAEVYRELLELELDHRIGKLDSADFQAQNEILIARAASLIGAEDEAAQRVDEQIEREIAAQRAALRAASQTTGQDVTS